VAPFAGNMQRRYTILQKVQQIKDSLADNHLIFIVPGSHFESFTKQFHQYIPSRLLLRTLDLEQIDFYF